MKVYLDICCPKRPFDDQSQPRIAVESAAVVAPLVAAERGMIELLRSAAHDLENAADPDAERRAALAAWLQAAPPPAPVTPEINARFATFRSAGPGQMDALHLAWAEHLRADARLTTDDRFIARASPLTHTPHVRAINPATLTEELPR